MAIANLTTIPFDRDHIAIAVTHSPLGAGHIGLAFHSAKEGPKVLHLEWHHRLKVHSIERELTPPCWVAESLNVPTSLSKQLVAIVRTVAARGARINYGLNFVTAKGSFDATGKYKPPSGSDGLTCASFVVEVLRASSIDLVQIASWPKTAANEVWGNTVCEMLARTADADHLAAVKRNVSGLRLRPFEVAGAARLGPRSWPALFDIVQEPADEIAAELAEKCPAPAVPAA